jgi:hypothetical protein
VAGGDIDMSEIIEGLHESLCHAVEGVKRNWKNPDEVRVTVVVRNIKVDDGNVVIGDDDPEKSIEVIRDFMNRDPSTFTTKGARA